ncbi:polysaccharide biosynthesis/export family protein [uncultured Tateyamaria sp.]|uniref:polysaccharide biosynthesis/export family protein n=1 Tax=uncultured Tateyamaria sp. TaxID=455651 RepID=UPI00260DDBF3|nr:polysaccharide biosynthesis/export family protein [uncultured Tateyamaria sp.]
MREVRVSWRTKLRAVAATLMIAVLPLIVPLQSRAQTGTEAVESQKLAPQQVIDIRIGRWDPVQETYSDWPAVGGAYPISASGTVTLPIVGTLTVAGTTPDDLAMQISDQLQVGIGLRGNVEVVVNIAEFAPIYVLGDVRTPGVYPHAPQLTVLQALSLAGGIDGPGTSFVQGESSALNALGNYRVRELELLRRLATLSRLQAEEAETEMTSPEELTASSLGAELIAEERRIMAARQSAFSSSLAQIDDLDVLLRERIARLNAQAELREKQLGLLEGELRDAASLVERGLSTTSRQSALQRQVTDQQVRLLEVETARLNAEQRLNEARRDRLDLVNERSRELVQGLQDQRAAIGELRLRMETDAALFADATRTGTGLVQLSALVAPQLQITRQGAEGPMTFPVGRGDFIQGGDVLEVVLDVPSPNDAIPMRRLSEPATSSPSVEAAPSADPKTALDQAESVKKGLPPS